MKDFAYSEIRQGGSGIQAGQIVYTPPRGNGVIEAKPDNLVTFKNQDSPMVLYSVDQLNQGVYVMQLVFKDKIRAKVVVKR